MLQFYSSSMLCRHCERAVVPVCGEAQEFSYSHVDVDIGGTSKKENIRDNKSAPWSRLPSLLS
jgi:hypothetical protein